MIDIHAHILPGMDDGAEDTYEMLQMAQQAVSSGVKAIVATPHCNLPGLYQNYYDKNYAEQFHRARKVLNDAGIPLHLYAGMEVFVTPDLPDLIRERKILTLNGGNYILLEFAFDEEETYANDMLEKITKLGLIPVIAHPERYEFLHANPNIARLWKQKGYVLQANKGSFMGRFGNYAYNMAYQLLEQDLYSVIASDCHSHLRRTPQMTNVYKELSSRYSTTQLKVLFEDNPYRICANQKVITDIIR